MTDFADYEDLGRAYASGNGSAAAEGVRFRFTQFADIRLDTAPPYLVDGILPRIGVVVVWGPPKCGKTFWVFDIEMHVALGWEYRGRRVEQGVILHIACEGVAGLGARKEAWRITRLTEDTEDASIPFYLCKDTTLDLIADADKVIEDIAAQHSAHTIRIITIDTLNRSLVGSESKDEDMTKYLRAAVALAAQFQCLVIIIHHCGYDASHPRGHTSLRGGADADISVKKDAAGRVLTKVETMRDGADGAQTLSRLAVVDVGLDDNGNPITSCVIDPDDDALGAPPPGKPEKLPAAARLGLQQLRNCFIDHPVDLPADPKHFPPGQGVTLAMWRSYLEDAGIINKDGNPREQFRRIRVTLQDRGFAGVYGDFAWLVTERHVASQ